MGAFDDLLGFDPVEAAEQVTGHDSADPRTILLAALMEEQNESRKREELGLRMDTYHGMSYDDAMESFIDLGFTNVSYRATSGGESWKLFWHEDGILLAAESATPLGIETPILASAPASYNIRVKSGLPPTKFLSAVDFGHFSTHNSDVWVGWSDFTEGARHKMERLRENGEFLPEWKERPWGAIPPVGAGPIRLVQSGKARREDAVGLFLELLPAHIRGMVISAGEVSDPAYTEYDEQSGS